MDLRKKHPYKPLPNDKPRCGDFGGIREGKEIHCMRDPDHKDDHYCETEHGIYQWRNKEKR